MRFVSKGFFLTATLTVILSLLFCKTQNIPSADQKPLPVFDYDAAWHSIDSLEQNQLYQSALERTHLVREAAMREQNGPQLVKAAVYINKYAVHLNEDGIETAIKGMEDAIRNASEPARSILFSLTAELYATYVQSHTWKLKDRTTLPGVPGDDIRTWDITDFIQKINQYYLRSITEDQLKSIPVAAYEAILTRSVNTDNLRPVLYDILAHRAVDYFVSDHAYYASPVDAYVMTDLDLLSPAEQFSQYGITSTDTSSFKRKAIAVFQALIAFHLNDASPEALIAVDLQRLEYIYTHLEHEGKDAAYLRALNDLEATYHSTPGAADIGYAKAQYYQMQSGKYHGGKDDPHQNDLKIARDICEAVVRDYPDSRGAALCRNMLTSLVAPALSVRTEEVIPKGEHILVNVTFKNVPVVNVRLVRLPGDYRNLLQGKNEEILNTLLGLEVIAEKTVSLPVTEDLREHTTETYLNPLDYGFYALLVSDGGFTKDNLTGFISFHISDMAFWNYFDPETQEFVVVDRKTGAPLSDVNAEFYTWEYEAQNRMSVLRLMGTNTTDTNGFAPYHAGEQRNSILVKLMHGRDTLFLDDHFYFFRNYNEPKGRQAVFLFTDRSIYRPGQPVYFKGYLVDIDKDRMPSIRTKGEITVTLMDANGQEVTKQTFTPNAYGTFSGEFKAPEDRLAGRMRLLASGAGTGSAPIQVEEYKRPTFEVTFDPATRAYQLGADVTLSGKAMTYAGVPTDRGNVRYTVVRKVQWPWYAYGRGWVPDIPRMIIAQGTTETDDGGNFNVAFNARGDASVAGHRPEYVFEVSADVTDAAGETRSAQKQIILGARSFRINIGLSETVELNTLSHVALQATNLNNEPMQLAGAVRIDKLAAPDRPMRERYWETPDMPILDADDYGALFPAYTVPGLEEMSIWKVAAGAGEKAFVIQGDDSLSLRGLITTPGAYRLSFHFTADNGDTSNIVLYTHCFDTQGDLPQDMLFTETLVDGIREPGNVVSHLLLTSPPLHILYVTDRQSGIIQKWIEDHGVMNQTITLDKSDRGGLRLYGTFVYDNRVHSFNQYVQVPWTNKDLHIEYLSWRDKTEPGAEEEWHLRISGPDKEPAVAELLATMYDASLDAFLPHQWSLNLYPTYRGKGSAQAAGFTIASLRYLFVRPSGRYVEVPNEVYRNLNWFDFPMYHYAIRDFGIPKLKGAPPMAEMAEERSIPSDVNAEPGSIETEEEEQPATQEETPIALRSNLKETVFFYPHITSGPDGSITLKFKMNEALTKWKFLALAHTTDLKYGLSEKEVVTQKDLMVFPHMPRFLRQQDHIALTAKVHNMTADQKTGKATLTLVDAETGADVSNEFHIDTATQNIQLPANGSTGVAWQVTVPEDWTAPLKYQVVVRSGNKGDGEEGLLPVLTDRVFVTETMALHIPAVSDSTFEFDAFRNAQSTTLENFRYTVEFTSNPAWLAVQSLPYLEEYPHQCAEQVWNRLYANLIARKIVTTFPEIAETYQRWTEQPGSVSLMSNLSKNQELKSALLEETPWVRDAMSEEAQMRNIAQLLNGEHITTESRKAISTLKQMQLSNGGLPWFPGGHDNRYITQYLVESAGHLSKLDALDPGLYNELMQVIYPAIEYIDARLLEDYQKLAEQVKEGKTTWEADHLSSLAAQYLYARSFFRSKEMRSEVGQARDYYLGQAEKYWNKRPLYIQALLALSLQRWNQSPVVKTMRQSFEERSLSNDELGRYWKADNGYYWYELPIERQALMIELFEELGAPQEWIDEMRIWLLKNKQTNRWTSTKATAAAIYALLMQNDNWLHGAQIAIRVAGKPLEHLTPEAGSGYIKQSWPADSISADQGEVSVHNPNNHVAWGGLYWQYFEDMDKVRSATDTPLKMTKALYKQISTDHGMELTSMDEAHVGDKLIARIEIEVDRDMEFVHLKDMRASGLEPINVLSGYRWQGGLGYYQSTGDLATHFFFDYLPRGKYVFEYPLRVAHAGSFSNGIATLQCMYAPEFSSHSGGMHVVFK